jgi:hypothetical protein
MANSKKKRDKKSATPAQENQGIYGLNANKSSISKERSYIHGSELTGTVK